MACYLTADLFLPGGRGRQFGLDRQCLCLEISLSFLFFIFLTPERNTVFCLFTVLKFIVLLSVWRSLSVCLRFCFLITKPERTDLLHTISLIYFFGTTLQPENRIISVSMVTYPNNAKLRSRRPGVHGGHRWPHPKSGGLWINHSSLRQDQQNTGKKQLSDRLGVNGL